MDTMTYASVATLPKSVIEYSQHEMKLPGLTGNAIICHPVIFAISGHGRKPFGLPSPVPRA
jgi:hypothetical protein